MNLRLVSRDRELLKSCTKIVADLPGGPWTAQMISPEEYRVDGRAPGVYLCDFDPQQPLPEASEGSPSRKLFLVDRDDLVKFHELAGGKPAAVILKPITKETLGAFLTLAPDGNSNHAPSSVRADRDEILQCLIQASLRLQEYDQDRTALLARAVHDFWAPLVALTGYCDFLLGEPVGALNENQKEVLRRMHHSARRLFRMAVGIFQLSLERQRKTRPELSEGDVRDCLEQALREITHFADEKRIAISVDVTPSEDPLYFEAKQIDHLLVNLLENACKSTPKAGVISVRGYPIFWERRGAGLPLSGAVDRRCQASQTPNAYRVDIQDSGTAIPADRLGRVFDEYASDPDGSDRSGGGLGLAVCRMIASQHNGRIWAENSKSGPVFSFVLPFGAAQPPRVSEISDKTEYVEAL